MFCSNCGKDVGNSRFCPDCGARISSNQPQQQSQDNSQLLYNSSGSADSYNYEPAVKPPLYKKWWFWAAAIFCLIIIISIATNGKEPGDTVPSKVSATQEETEISVAESTEKETESSTEKVENKEPSSRGSSLLYDLLVGDDDEVDSDIPSEYRAALLSAKSYSENLHMSKKGIYEQLTSEYGEQFEPEAAQYAIDNLDADYKANALASAKNYRDNLHMSKAAIYDQLISEYGEQFTKEEAQYAIDNLD